MDEFPKTEEPANFFYKGVEIIGIDFFERNGILTRLDVINLLDRLPPGYFTHIPLGTISFVPIKLFSINRSGQILYVKDDELLQTDVIIARKRAVTSWNKKEEGGIFVPTDGKISITIFSPLNWEEKNNPQIDREIALSSLAHEIGHTIWSTIIYGPGIYEELRQRETPVPFSNEINNLKHFIEKWKKLKKSALPRYLEYERVFTQEHKSDSSGYLEISLEELSKEEDFATAFEYFLYWQSLYLFDQERNKLLEELFKQLNK